MDSIWAPWVYALLGILAVILGFVIARLIVVRKWGYCRNNVSLEGKTVLITGANCGIGFEAASDLVRRGATVIMACRSLEKGNLAAQMVNSGSPRGRAVVMELDLASFESVNNFATRIINEYPKIDILINNAGVAYPIVQDVKTEEGYEVNFGVNHLGHFLLTNLLISNAKISVKGRIIIVSSTLMKYGKIDFEDLNLTKTVEAIKNGSLSSRKDPGYANSKLMNAYHAKILAEKVKDFGIDVFVLCPGFTYSNLFRYAFKWYFIFLTPIFFLVMRSTKQGAQTTIYCSTEPSIEGKSGSFYRNCKEDQLPADYDKEMAERLWLISEDLTKLNK